MIRPEQLQREFYELLPIPQEDQAQQALRVSLATVFKRAISLAMETTMDVVELVPAQGNTPAVTTTVDAYRGFDKSFSDQANSDFTTVETLWNGICTAHNALTFEINDYKDQSNINEQHILVNLGNGFKKMSFTDVVTYLETAFDV